VKRIIFAARLGISLGLVAYLVHLLDLPTAAEALRRAAQPSLILVPLCLLVGFGVAAVRWQFILRRAGVNLVASRAFLAYLISNFYGLLLPGVLAGDVVRMTLCVRQTQCRLRDASASVLLERLCGFAALASFPLMVHVLAPQIVPLDLRGGDGVLLLACAAIALGVPVAIILVQGLPIPSRGRIAGFVHRTRQVIAPQSVTGLLWIMLLSAVFQTLDILATFVISQAMGLDLPLAALFFVVPFVSVATVLPISLGGLGVREVIFVFLLGKFAIGSSDAVMLSVMIYLGRLFVGALGAITQAVGPRFRPAGHRVEPARPR
jgi:hypothetical protein